MLVKVKLFLNEWGMLIIVPLTFIMFLRGCPTNGDIEGISEQIKKDAIKDSLAYINIAKEIKISGLEAEASMIRSCDRTKLDLYREAEIIKELKTLKGK